VFHPFRTPGRSPIRIALKDGIGDGKQGQGEKAIEGALRRAAVLFA
jgi:hypothetical protein